MYTRNTHMLYLDFDKFKSEAKRLKRTLNTILPDQQFTLNDAQNLIGKSLNFTNFNQLFVAHDKRMQQDGVNLDPYAMMDNGEQPLSHWVEFNNLPAFQIWARKRCRRMLTALREMHALPGINDKDVFSAVWGSSAFNTRLQDAFKRERTVPISLLNEKDWRGGISVLMDGEGYTDFMTICIPKLKRDGGFIVVNESQAINIINAWHQDDSAARVPIRLFNVDKPGPDDNHQVLSPAHPTLKPHACWPRYQRTKEESPFIHGIQTRFPTAPFSLGIDGNGLGLWEGRSSYFIESYLNALPAGTTLCTPPSAAEFIAAATAENIEKRRRAPLHSILSSLNIRPEHFTKPEAINVASREQYQYLALASTMVTATFDIEQEGVTPINLSDWASTPSMTICVVPNRQCHFAERFVRAMLQSLCYQQASLASEHSTGKMTKGVLFLPHPSLGERYKMDSVPGALKFCSLWGWASPDTREEYNTIDAWQDMQDIDKHAANMTAYNPDVGFTLSYRLFEQAEQDRLYKPWENSEIRRIK